MSDQPSIDLCETESVKSDTKSTKSSASTKPSNIKPPSSTASTRIGRPCCAGHLPKPGLPPLESKNNNMRRQSDDYSRSHLSDVFEESEADLMPESSSRSVKSKSPDSFSSKPPKSDRKISNGSTNSDLYMEATGRRHSSDQGTVLTTDTDSFIIGQRIWVGGIRPGLIAYIGETHFAPGEWAGVVLDDPNGKNDGCVAGKRYFQCEPKRGIFSRLTRLTREPLPGGATSSLDLSMNVSSRSITSPSRSGTVSPTHSMKSVSAKTPSKSTLAVGDRVIVSSGMGSRPGILQYMGETKFAAGNWCGVQLDEATGKNDGSVDGVKYFDCPPQYGIFVPVAKVSLSPSARKSRLSRSGSKESLTSVGTLGSIASTATSRLRMSAQRLSSTAKPINTPKNTFSLQEVLREKQNHIEHLLIERDLDRQDSENNAMMYQKTITQLKETIASLEKQLTSEKQKSEDLQTSVDEATFCTEELNVLTQEYKDRVTVLEAQLSGKETSDGKSSLQDTKQDEEILRLRSQCEALNASLAEKQSQLQNLEQTNATLKSEADTSLQAQQASINEATIKISALESSEKSIQDKVEYLTQRNNEMESELRLQDANKEKEYLNMKHIENELREEVDALKKEVQLREAAMAGTDSELQKLIEAKDTIISEQKEAAIGSEQLHVMIVRQKDEEIVKLNSSLTEQQKLYENVNNDKVSLIQEADKKANLIAELQMKVEESAELLVKFTAEVEANKKMISDNQQQIAQHEATIQMLEKKATELLTLNESLSVGVEKDKMVEAELRKQIENFSKDLTESQKRISELEQLLTGRDKCLEEQQHRFNDHQAKFEALTMRSEALQKELDHFKSDNVNKDESFATLTAQLESVSNELSEKCSAFEVSQVNLSSAIAESKVQSEQIASQTLEIEQLRSTVSTNAQVVDNLNNDVQSLKDRIGALTTENSNLGEQLKNTITSLDASKVENESQISVTRELKQEIEHLEKSLNAKNEAADKIQKLNENLQSKLEASVQNGYDLQEKVSKLEVEHGDITRKMILAEEKCEQLLREKASLQQNVDALQNSSSDTNSEVLRLSAELQQKQKSYDELADKTNAIQLSLEKKLHEITQSLSAKTSQLDDAKNEWEMQKMQKIERENELNLELSAMKEAAAEEKIKLEQEINSLTVSHQEERAQLLREINEKLQSSEVLRNEIQNLAKTIDELQNEVENSKKSLAEKDKEFADQVNVLQSIEKDLKNQLDESNKKESELRNFLNETTKSGADSVEQLTAKLNEKCSHASKLEQNIEEIRSKCDRMTEEHNELTIKFSAMEKLKDELIASHAAEIQQINEMKSELEHQLIEATSKFKSTEDEQVDLVNRNDEMAKQIEVLTEQLSESNNRKAETDQQLVSLASQFEAFKLSTEADKADISSKLTEYHRKEIESTESTKQLESQNAQLKQSIEDKQKEIETLRNTKDEYEKYKLAAATETETTQVEIKSLNNKAAEHIETIRLLEDKIVQLTSSVNLSDDLKNELNHKSEEIKSKEMKIGELSASVDSLSKQIDVKENDLKKVLGEREVEKKQSTDIIASRDEEIKSMQLQMETMKMAISHKTDEFTSLSDEKSSLVEDISRLNHQIEDYKKNFVDRSEFNNLKEEFSIYEETKCSEIDNLTKTLLDMEERFKHQSAGVDKLEILEREQKQISYEKTALQRREAELISENKQLAEKLKQMKASGSTSTAEIVSDSDSGAQISFLNSIIADMQRKNETLTHRIQALESAPSDFVNNGLFDLPVKRKPAPRLFCDICDEFDAHETEDCPLQSSDSPPPINLPEMSSTVNLISKDKERKLPPPRKYCDLCEVFGHDASECDNEETF